jgi:hypothetical protein
MRVIGRSTWAPYFHVLTFSLFYYFPYFYQSRSNDRNLGGSFPFLYHISPLVLWGAKPTAYTALGCARCLVTPSFSHLVCYFLLGRTLPLKADCDQRKGGQPKFAGFSLFLFFFLAFVLYSRGGSLLITAISLVSMTNECLWLC